MFNNNTNNNDISVNTGIVTLFSDSASLSIGCWNEKLSLRWMPSIGQDERGYHQYDKDRKVSTSLTHVKIAALLKKYNEHIKPHLDAGDVPDEKGWNAGVPISSKTSTNILLIEYKADEQGVPNFYLTFVRNPTPAADPANIVTYKFNKMEVLVDYDPTTGESVDEVTHSEFDDFMDILKARKLMTGLTSHAHRFSSAFKIKGGFSGGSGGYMPPQQPPMNMNQGGGMPDFMYTPLDMGDEIPFN